MSYELNQKLKEAGWPQPPGQYLNDPYSPELSELIEACGNHFGNIGRYADGWIASAYKPGYIEIVNQTGGSTPEEAVANLWLSLNKPTNIRE